MIGVFVAAGSTSDLCVVSLLKFLSAVKVTVFLLLKPHFSFCTCHGVSSSLVLLIVLIVSFWVSHSETLQPQEADLY